MPKADAEGALNIIQERLSEHGVRLQGAQPLEAYRLGRGEAGMEREKKSCVILIRKESSLV